MRSGRQAARRGEGEQGVIARGRQRADCRLLPRNRREKADEAFRIGIARKAQPLKRLQTNYQAFQARPPVAVAAEREADAAQTHVTPGGANGRKVLGTRSAVPQAGGSSSTTRTPGASGATPRNGARLDIFVDGPVPGATAEDQAGTTWEELGTREGNRKENTVEAVGWKGETLPQSKTAAARIAPRTPKMEVFKDNVSSCAAELSSASVRLMFVPRHVR